MQKNKYLSIEPQLEMTKYGDHSIIIAPNALYRIRHPQYLKTQFGINDACRAILMLIDGTRTYTDIVDCLLNEYEGEDVESIERYVSEALAMVEGTLVFKLIESDTQVNCPIHYSEFESRYPSVISIELTNQCNMRCKHCYGDYGHSDAISELPEEKIEYLMESFVDAGVKSIEITGGDPSVYPHTGKVIESAFANGMSFVTYLSNGLHLDDAVFDTISRYRNRVLVQMDLHSQNEEYSRWFTGVTNVVDCVKENICRLISNSVAVCVSMVVTPGNLDELESICDWAYEAGACQFAIAPVIELGRATGKAEDLIISDPEDVAQLEALLKTLVERYPGFIRESRGWDNLNRKNCGALLPHATVRPNGAVKICPMDSIPDRNNQFGNVLKEDIKTLYDRNSHFIEQFSNLRPPTYDSKGCLECDSRFFCNTCIARSLLVAQSKNGSCEWYENSVPQLVKDTLGIRR